MDQFILSQTEHRPWPMPDDPWSMRQSWHDLLFIHWPIPVAQMRALVPIELELDTFDDQAWIGLVPFRMFGVRPRLLPALPWLSAFPELNLRTYVRARSTTHPKPGVFFFSLDAANPLAVTIARKVYLLPYFRARMQVEEQRGAVHYTSSRTHTGAPSADLLATYAPTDGIYHATQGSLDQWLTERYCLYTLDGQKNVLRAEIHHLPWPLQPAELEIQKNTVAEAAGITLPDTEPVLHFARRQDVFVWPLRHVPPEAGP